MRAQKMTEANNKWILIALFISVFTIGTSEYVIMGILPVIATDLSITYSDCRTAGNRLCIRRSNWQSISDSHDKSIFQKKAAGRINDLFYFK